MLLLSRIRTRLTRSTIENITSPSTIERRYVFTDAIRTFLTFVFQCKEETSKKVILIYFLGNYFSDQNRTFEVDSEPDHDRLIGCRMGDTRETTPRYFQKCLWSLCIHAYIHKVWSIVQFIGGSQIHFSNILVSQDHCTNRNGPVPISLFFLVLV